jgi:Bacterial Ig-like domain (group 3)/PKD domain/Bacterial pre-peptidase C-terminal domain/RTX calcium-binding nonapeptide repeat (4 copies)
VNHSRRLESTPFVELLEERTLLALFVVSNTNDSGAGSLRQAIIGSNAAGGSNTIDFQIGAPGSQQTIVLASGLPAVTKTVMLDGWSQGAPGYTGPPLIVLDGAGLPIAGLNLSASNSTIRGLVINNMLGSGVNYGIGVFGNNNFIEGNYIGTTADGTAAYGAQIDFGVYILGSGNVIGTDGDGANDAAEGNLISGNFYGMFLQDLGVDPTGNVIAGNKIGTNAAGTAAVPNTIFGVYIHNLTVANTRIGTNGDGTSDTLERNIISGNGDAGVLDFGVGTVIAGNYLGTDLTGTVALGGGNVAIFPGSTNARVGVNPSDPNAAAERNIISGNVLYGVEVVGPGTTGAVIAGNYIGLAADGTTQLSNTGSGVLVRAGATGTTVGGTSGSLTRNVISGSTGPGIRITDSGTTGNVVEGNYIGTDPTGASAIANKIGVQIDTGASNNLIGQVSAAPGAAGNVISGNTTDGVLIQDPGTILNTVAGNLIGTTASGAAALRNGGTGVRVTNGATSNEIGGGTVPERNIISGNGAAGVDVVGGNAIQGNYIGTDKNGSAAIPNANGVIARGDSTVIGGITPFPQTGVGNLISGNTGFGVELNNTTNAFVATNLIGTNAAGAAPLGNNTGIIDFGGTATNNLIGADNVISGNKLGIQILSSGTRVLGNAIGTDQSGTQSIGNVGGGFGGILIQGANNVVDVLNIISSNDNGVVLSGAGAHDNIIRGSFIGTDRTGSAALQNLAFGVVLRAGANHNTIGGLAQGDGNMVGFNGVNASAGGGIEIMDAGTTFNTIAGNTLSFNNGPGLWAINPADSQNSVTQNRVIGNAGLGIDVGPSQGVTPNDSGDTDGFLNTAVVTSASIRGAVMDVAGFARPGSMIEFYVAGVDTAGFGEGTEFIGAGTEGSTQDADPTTGFYSSPLRGLNVGSDTTAKFHFTMPVPGGVAEGSVITAVVVGIAGSTTPAFSEFSGNITADAGAPFGAPIVNAGGDATITQGATFTGQGVFTDLDSFHWTAQVDFGDGAGFHPLALNPVNYSPAGDQYTPTANATFDLAHVYNATGVFHVVVKVMDDSGATGVDTLSVTVVSAPPLIDNTNIHLTPSIINENDSVSLSGLFSDASPVDSHTVQVIWGDGQTSFALVDENAKTFADTHQYLDDSPKNTQSDVYPVQVIITDITSNQAKSTFGLFYVQVNNVGPSNLMIHTDTSSLSENGSVVLSGTFFDPGSLDRHKVTVDWGDGSKTTLLLGPNDLSFPGVAHTYLNNPATPASSDTITVSVADDDEPLSPITAATSVAVSDVPASALVLSPSTTLLTEGSSFTLGGTFFDPGALDRHNVAIDWGDGSSPTHVALGAGVMTFSGVQHLYRDNPTGHPDFVVTVSVTDPAEPAGPPATSTLHIIVTNVAPSVTSLSLLGADGQPLQPGVPGVAGKINENDGVLLSGSYADAGLFDRHTVMVDWGDGSTSAASVDSVHRTFHAKHHYDDNPVGTLIGVDHIHVAVKDNDGANNAPSNGNIALAVANVAPTVQILSGGITVGGAPILIAKVSDAGPVDGASLSYIWMIDAVVAGTGPSLTLPTTFNTSYTVTLTVTDNDSASTSASTLVSVLDDNDNVYQVADPGPGVSQVIVFGLGGDDIIAAGQVSFDGGGHLMRDAHGVPIVTNPLNISVVLDGGLGADTLIGGNASDVIYLHQGNDSAYGLGGNDSYMLTPNSTLTVVDGSGQNTLDFSVADFGVTFDLAESSGQAQDVAPAPATAGQHFVSADDEGTGQFATLIGSGYADALTVASNASIYGGAGSDNLFVGDASNTTYANVFVDGGADADTLTINPGATLSGLSFNGDEGGNALLNQGALAGSIVFNGGADADTFQNTGVVSGAINFNGDDGANNLINAGSLAGVVFNGGADADSLINNATGSLSGAITFNGDDGANQFTNAGTVGIGASITFNGGADADTLTNASGGMVAGGITFNGDDGANALTNSGALGSLLFNGGADGDALTNASGGMLTGTISFNGDDGANQFTNAGTVGATASITFTGGADADTFTNSGAIVGGMITFNGDDGGNQFTNAGTVGPGASINVGGGADADVLINSAAGALGGAITFNGDAGADQLTNAGAVTGTITFSGGADADTLTNLLGGTVGGAINFNGDAGADLLVNAGSVTGGITFSGGADGDALVNTATGAASGSITFNGDAGADNLVNLGMLGSVVFNGGADGDTLTNAGTVGGTITFHGDDGANALYNGATISGVFIAGSAGAINFSGGADADLLVNRGAVSGAVSFNGDVGADTLANFGSVGSITFNGGADGDTLTNSATVGSINFNGDAGADTLITTGSGVGQITFNGDQGADQFLNQGNNVGAIVFNGGADANLFVNTGNSVGSINMQGGADADVFANTGTGVGAMSFQGDAGADTLINTGGGLSTTITFNGGADGDTLINSGPGLAAINFNGDAGADALVNSGSNIGAITFNGGADANALLNTGGSVAAITFNGGADADVLRNDGPNVGAINFNGDDGANYLLNNGSVSTLTFTGGADADTFVNTGAIGGAGAPASSFNGDDGADVLYNTAGGTVSGLVFTGGADADTLINSGVLVNLTFNGDDGANTLYNNASGAVSGLVFNGGADADALLSHGSLTGLSFNGDDGANSLLLAGSLSSAITFTGGADADTLIVSQGAGAVSGVTFNGDAGADMLVNQSAGATNITFNGGADADTFWNLADNVAGLNFQGDSGADSFVNMGGLVSGVSVHGDDGADSLANYGANVGTIIFNGGADGDTLTNAGINTGAITFHGDAGADVLTNTASGVGLIDFHGDDGADAMANSGADLQSLVFNGGADADTLTNSGVNVGSITFHGDSGADSLTNSANGVQSIDFHGDDGPDAFVSSGALMGLLIVDGGAGDDTFVLQGSAAAATFTGDDGNDAAWIDNAVAPQISLAGGAGDDTYKLIGAPQANVTIDETYAGPSDVSADTVDFSTFASGGIALDLALTTPQLEPGGLALLLTDANGVENVSGTSFGDTVWGNDRPNILKGSGIPDTRLISGPYLTASSYQAGSQTQWVLLDFDTFTTDGEHVYNQTERDAIQARVTGNYIGPDPNHPWLNVKFKQRASDLPADVAISGQYATEYFNRTPSFDRPGGEASEVDFGNTNLGGYTAVQVNGLVGGSEQPDSTSNNIVLLSAKIAAHELAHLMGVRHSDVFGPIGSGVHTPPGSDKFTPNAPPAAAFETFDHLISSPATDGTTRFNDLGNLYFGPREAIKLAFADHGTILPEQPAAHSAFATAQPLPLAALTVPNTTTGGTEQGLSFQVGATAVAASIGLDPATGQSDPDFYSFTGRKGDVLSFEVDSVELARLFGQNTIDSVLSVYDSVGNLVPYYGASAFNDDQFETTDSMLYDVALPADGTYYVKVTTFARSASDPVFDPTNPSSPLNPANLDSLVNPLNPKFSQDLLNRFLATKTNTATGQYDLIVYRYNQSNPTDHGNHVNGRGGDDTIIAYSGSDMLIGGAGHDFIDNGSGGPAYVISVSPASTSVTVPFNAAFAEAVTFADPSGSAVWNVTINYGDGPSQTLTPYSSIAPVNLDHQYAAPGNYTVLVSVQNDDGTTGQAQIFVQVTNTKPTVVVTDAGGAFTGNPFPATGTVAAPGGAAGSTLEGVALTLTYYVGSTATGAGSATAPTSVGTYTVVATFPGSAHYLSASATTTFNITPATPTVVVTDGGGIYKASPYAATATVTGVSGGPATTLEGVAPTFLYFVGATPSGVGSVTAPTSVGTYTVVATFAGSADYSSASAQTTFTISKATPTVAVSDAGGVFNGSPYPAAATVTGVIGGAATTLEGVAPTLAYYLGTTLLGGPPSAAGTYSVVASFAGSTNYAAASSSQVPFTITPRATTTTVASSAPTAAPGQPVTFTATVSGGLAAPNIPTGTVQFKVDGQAFGSPVSLTGNGTAAITWSSTVAGAHSISAVYSGNSNFLTSVSQNATQNISGPGVYVVGSTLYVVGSANADTAQINAAGGQSGGSTGLQVSAVLNNVPTATTYLQAFTAVVITGYDGNDSFSLAAALTVATTVIVGNGSDAIALGGGNSTVQVGTGNNAITGGNGNDSIQAGGGNNTIALGNGNNSVQLGGGNNTVTLGNGNDSVQAGAGNNTITLGNGNDSVQLGNGDNVVVEGSGTDSVSAGNGANLVVGGTGQHTIQLGNGNNILIDGSATVVQANDSFRKILTDWKSSASTSVNTRIHVTYNTTHPNFLYAGTGRNWFFVTNPATTTNRKATDRLN